MIYTKKFFYACFFVFLFMFAFLFSSCSTVAADLGDEPVIIEIDEPVLSSPPARDELFVVFQKNILEFDPRQSYMATEAQIFTAIYEGLFSYHPITMAAVPAAAYDWDLSSDRKEWTFYIRDDALFQNGDPVRAEDFRAAWLSLLEPEREAPYSSLFDIIEGARDFRLGNAARDDVAIIALDEKTLYVRLNSPAAFFPSMLCHHSFSPIHPSMINETSAAAWSRPISNGPFIMEDMDEDRIVFVKNPLYWEADLVALNKITIVLSDDEDRTSEFWNSREAHWVSANINFDNITYLSGLEVNAMFATHYYYIRSVREPWSDYRLRRALSLALPWNEIRDSYMLPASTLIFPIRDYPEIEGVELTNVAEARSLLTEAGYHGGFGLPEIMIKIPPSSTARHIALLMARAWQEELGIRSRIDIVPYSEYFDSLKLPDHDVASITWIGDFADPFAFLQMWQRESNLNDAGHSDDDFEVLIERSMYEEGLERWSTLAEAEALLLSRGNVLPIYYHPAINFIDTGEIDGWFPNALDMHPFKYLSIRQRRALPGIAALDTKVNRRSL